MFATHFRRIASVPFASKDAAKSLGCTWVQSAKGWQISRPAAETELAKIEGVAFGWHLPGDRRAWNAQVHAGGHGGPECGTSGSDRGLRSIPRS